jgi:hypothetical protein
MLVQAKIFKFDPETGKNKKIFEPLQPFRKTVVTITEI